MTPHFVKSPKRTLQYYYLLSSMYYVIQLIIILMLGVTGYFAHWSDGLIYLWIGLFIIVTCYNLIWPWLKYQYTYYRFDGNHIEIHKAFIFKANEVFKIERTQFLIRKSNPLLQKLRLCKISAVSAGHNIDCPLLDENIAIQFENDTLKQLKGADFDV
ncbi:Bacterial membrane flanked domain protein [Staphylococcus arlettae]|nr:Bacterial membrane flanked domain protein [Staphylococcus arlettae]